MRTDASNLGLGTVLAQMDEFGGERVITYASRTLTARGKKCATMKKEALALVFGIEHFRVYLMGNKFELATDNSALRLLNSVTLKGRIARWIMDLQEFNFTVRHRPGHANQNADALSRLPQEIKSKIAKEKGPRENPSSPNCMVSLIPKTNLRAAQQVDYDICKVLEL